MRLVGIRKFYDFLKVKNSQLTYQTKNALKFANLCFMSKESNFIILRKTYPGQNRVHINYHITKIE